MSHNHIEQGDYSKKHPENTEPNKAVIAAIKENADDTHLSCRAAERIATNLGVEMEFVGVNADLLEIKIDRCQLGLFGYTRSRGKRRIMTPKPDATDALKSAIKSSVVKGKLPCTVAWDVAKQMGVSRLVVCSVAEALGIKTSSCQLGTF